MVKQSLQQFQSPEAFQEFLDKEAHGDARKARAWLEAKYCELKNRQAPITKELREGYAELFSRNGREDIAARLKDRRLVKQFEPLFQIDKELVAKLTGLECVVRCGEPFKLIKIDDKDYKLTRHDGLTERQANVGTTATIFAIQCFPFNLSEECTDLNRGDAGDCFSCILDTDGNLYEAKNFGDDSQLAVKDEQYAKENSGYKILPADATEADIIASLHKIAKEI